MRDDHDDKSAEVGRRSHDEREDGLTQDSQLTPDLIQFADRLGSFVARSTELDRDALMFAAGQASCRCMTSLAETGLRTSPPMWQAATAAMTIVACSLTTVLVTRPFPEPRVIVVERERVIGNQTDQSLASTTQVVNDASNAKGQRSSSDDVPNSDADRQLADAWKARQKMIDQGAWNENRLALAASELPTTISNGDVPASQQPALIRAEVMGQRSREAIHELLKEQL